MQWSSEQIRSLIEPGRVQRRIYSDPEIFELEMSRIFGRMWIYVAHESQLKVPGDFVRTRLGHYDVVVTRHSDGSLHVLHNSCSHRGARYCSAEHGNTTSFICPYHGWSFGNDGALQGVPHRESYPPAFKLSDPAHHLFQAPRVDSYRGFVFASLASKGPSLLEHLGTMTDAFDNLIDRAPAGEIEISEHSFRILIRGNWKMHNENANDGYHPGFVHESSIAAARNTPPTISIFDDGDLTRVQLMSNARGKRDWEELVKVGFDNGHNYGSGFYRSGVLAPGSEDPVRQRYRAALAARVGDQRAGEIIGLNRFNNMIYPNLGVNSQYSQIRMAHPVAVDQTLVVSHCFRLKGAPEEMFHRAVRFMSNLGSPASMIYADDAEVFHRCQAGMEEGGNPWLDFSRGLGNDEPGPDGGYINGASELTMRSQFMAWLNYMTAEAA